MINLDAIEIHLTLKDHATEDGKKIQSCLTAALNEARYITARDTSTGLPDETNKHGSLGRWAGAMCYITILDQIGSCYRPAAKAKIHNGSSIEKALHYFTNLHADEIVAIYALRNAFLHDFSLLNIYPKKLQLNHSFIVDNHPTNHVVFLPADQWDGQIMTRSLTNQTYVNLRGLGDLVEDVYKELLILHSKNELLIDLAGGENELINRYTYVH